MQYTLWRQMQRIFYQFANLAVTLGDLKTIIYCFSPTADNMNMYEELTSKSLQTRVTQARDTVKSSRVGSLLTTRNVTNSLLFILVASCSVMSYYQMIKYVSGKTTVAKSVDTSQKVLVCCRKL